MSFASRRGSVPHRHRTGRRIALLGAAALYLFGALPAMAQEPDPLSKLDPSSRKQIELTLDSAEAEGIPARPILLKAYEGIAKHAPDRKIVAEVKKKFSLLRTARGQLGAVDEGELDAAAGLIDKGVKPEQLTVFRVREKGRSDLEAMAVWADFIQRGVPPNEAYTAITKLWHDGADDATFHGLWMNVQGDILKGANPGAALQNRIRENPTRTPAGPGKPPEGPQ